MGSHVRRVFDEGVRAAYDNETELSEFLSTHDVSPGLSRLLQELRSFRLKLALPWS